jgi:hypothetical protein
MNANPSHRCAELLFRAMFVTALLSLAPSASDAQPSTPPLSTASQVQQMWSGGRQQGRGPVRLRHFPLRVEDIGNIGPLGMMVWGHVVPSDHLGIAAKDRRAPRGHYPVIAPADGFIVAVQRATGNNPDPGVKGQFTGEFMVVIEHTGTFYSWLGLIDDLDTTVVDAIGPIPRGGPPTNVRVAVTAGQTIGRVGGGHGVDFTVINLESTLKGFVNPRQFEKRDPWKPHVADPFDYVDEPLRSRLLAFNPRKAAPPGGKIDHDVDGTAAGSWYREGTGGYAGLNRRLDYWVGHLALAPHHIATTRTVASIGDFNGQPRQFWVKENSPDPAKVRVGDAPVKYELTFGAINNAGQPYPGIDTNRVHGVLLVQLVAPRRLKVEVLAGRTAGDVRGFTEAATFYER